MPSALFTTGLPSASEALANIGPAAVQGQQQGMALARNLAMLDAQIKSQQQANELNALKLKQARLPFFQEFKPGSRAYQIDPNTGQPTGKTMEVPLDPLQQAHAKYYEALGGRPMLRNVGGTPMQFDTTTGSFIPVPGTPEKTPLSKAQQVIAARLFPGVSAQTILSTPEYIERIQEEESRLAGSMAGAKESARGAAQEGLATKTWSKDFNEVARAMGIDPTPGVITPSQIQQVHARVRDEQIRLAGAKAKEQEEVRTESPRAMFDRDDAQIAMALYGKNPMQGDRLTRDEIAGIDAEKDRRKMEFASAQAGAKAMPPEQAGKMSMLNQAQMNVGTLRAMLFPNGTLDRGLIAQSLVGLPGTPGRDVNVLIEDAVSAKYRLETGAAGNQEEVRSIAQRFKPSIMDSPQTVALKLSMLESFMQSSLALTDPTGVRRTSTQDATKIYQQAVDKMFQEYGIQPSAPQMPKATIVPRGQSQVTPSDKVKQQRIDKRIAELKTARNSVTGQPMFTDEQILQKIKEEDASGRFNPPRYGK